MFFHDPLFWKSFWNTIYMVIGIPVGMALSLGLSLLLNTKVKGIAVWRTLFYMPSIIPALWRPPSFGSGSSTRAAAC